MDAGTDRTGDDDEVALDRGTRDHLTITSPSMSRLCSVQTYW